MDKLLPKKSVFQRPSLWIMIAVPIALIMLFITVVAPSLGGIEVGRNSISVKTVVQGQFHEYIAATGVVVPLTTVYLDLTQGGRIEQLYVEEGANVVEGQPLLQLANANIELEPLQREGQMYEHMNALRNTRVSLEQNSLQLMSQLADVNYQLGTQTDRLVRLKPLHEQKFTTAEEFKQAEQQVAWLEQRRSIIMESMRRDSLFRTEQITQLEQSVARMQTSLLALRSTVEALNVKAPVNGVLTSFKAEKGQSKTVGERIGQIDDITAGLKIRVDIDEHYRSKIRIGLPASYMHEGQTYSLTVKKVNTEIVNGLFQAELEFDKESPAFLTRGQSLQIKIELGGLQQQAVLLPRGAFVNQAGAAWVYVIERGDSSLANRKSITMGRQNPEYIEVLSGVAPGDRVVTSGYENFSDVEKLKIAW